MANTIKSLVTFTSVPAGGSITLPHNIKIPTSDQSIRPDIATVTGGAAALFTFLNVGQDQITATNTGAIAADVTLLCEYWHSLEREFGGSGTTQLQSPTLFVYSGGTSNAGNCGVTILPGSNKAAEINAAITALSTQFAADGRQRTLTLACGLFTLEASVVMKSGVVIDARNTVVRSTAAFVGGADTVTNCLFGAQGAATGAVTTTATILGKGLNQVTLAAPIAGVVIGDFVRVQGFNASSNSLFDSDGATVVLTEIFKVSNIAGAVYTFTTQAQQYHAVGVNVQKFVPVTDVGILGGYFDASVAGTCAVGVLLSGVLRYQVATPVDAPMTFRGFTRTAVRCEQGTKIGDVGELVSDGSNNGVLQCESIMSTHVRLLRSIWGRERENLAANAIPRGFLYMNHRCTSVRVDETRFETCPIGHQVFGGHEISFGSLFATDIDATNANARQVAVNERDAGGTGGGAYEMDPGKANMDEVTVGITWDEIKSGNMTVQVADFPQWKSIWIHDGRLVRGERVVVDNDGLSAMNFTLQGGVHLRDCNGRVERIESVGVIRGLLITGDLSGLNVGSYAYNGVADNNDGATCFIALEFGETGPNGGPVFDEMLIGNVTNPFYVVDATFTAAPDWAVRVGRLVSPEGTFYNAMTAQLKAVTATTLAIGNLVETLQTSAAGTLQIEQSAVPNPRGSIVALTPSVGGGDGAGFFFIAPCPPSGPSTISCTAAAVNVGDIIEQSSTAKLGVVNNASYNPVGRALTNKAAVLGSVLVGPVAFSPRVPLVPLVAQASTHQTVAAAVFADITLAGGPDTDGTGVTVPDPGGAGMDLVIRFCATFDNANYPAYTTFQILVGGVAVPLSPQATTSPAAGGFPQGITIETKVHIAAGAAKAVKVQWKTSAGTSSIDNTTTFEGATLTVERYPS